MARLVTSGFEEAFFESSGAPGGSAFWTDHDSGAGVGRGGPARSGAHGLRIPGGNIRKDHATKSSGTLWYRVYLRPITLPPSAFFAIIQPTATTNSLNLEARLQTDGTVLLSVVGGSSATSSTVLSVDTVYRLELRVLLHASTGEAEVKLFLGDATTPLETLSLTSQNTLANGNVDRFYMGGGGSAALVVIDDVAVNDDTGAFQNTWTGPGAVARFIARGDTSVQWTKTGDSPKSTGWEGVLPSPAGDGNVDYNEDSGTTNVDRFGLVEGNPTIPPNSTLVLMDVTARMRAGATSQTAILRVWDHGGTPTDGPSIALLDTNWRLTTPSEHQVVSLAGVSMAQLLQYSVGYKGASGASAKRVTQIEVAVEYLPGSVRTMPVGGQLALAPVAA